MPVIVLFPSIWLKIFFEAKTFFKLNILFQNIDKISILTHLKSKNVRFVVFPLGKYDKIFLFSRKYPHSQQIYKLLCEIQKSER